jgi:uncharacterized membrane protein YtjA (UPF0391 family)
MDRTSAKHVREGFCEGSFNYGTGVAKVKACPDLGLQLEEVSMLHYAVVFFIIALVAALFGFGGIAAGAAGIAKVLFVIFLVLFVVSLLGGMRGRWR